MISDEMRKKIFSYEDKNDLITFAASIGIILETDKAIGNLRMDIIDEIKKFEPSEDLQPKEQEDDDQDYEIDWDRLKKIRNKRELEGYARTKYNIELNCRLTLKNMLLQLAKELNVEIP